MILGISGSPRKDGVTANAIKRMLEDSGKEYEYVSLSGKKINGCISCLECVKTNKCVVKDDFIDIGEKMKKAELIIIGIPNYYNTMNALSHALLERCYSFRHTGVFELENKPVVMFTTGYDVDVENSPVLNSGINFINHNKMNLIHKFAVGAFSQCLTCPEGLTCEVGYVCRKYGKVDKLTPDMYPPKFNENKESLKSAKVAVDKIKEYLRRRK